MTKISIIFKWDQLRRSTSCLTFIIIDQLNFSVTSFLRTWEILTSNNKQSMAIGHSLNNAKFMKKMYKIPQKITDSKALKGYRKSAMESMLLKCSDLASTCSSISYNSTVSWNKRKYIPPYKSCLIVPKCCWKTYCGTSWA